MAKKFAELIEKEGTLIVDALNLAFRWKHQSRSDFRYDFEETIQSLARSYSCNKIIITADWGSSSYRKNIFPDYKGNRNEKYANQTEAEEIAFLEFIEEYQESLKVLETSGYPVLRYKGVEADDIAAHLVANREDYSLKNIWLVSSDRDWDLLIAPGVNRFSYVTRKEVTWDNWSTHYDVAPEDYISLKCLQGDSGDNVPGILGIGPKRALTLIEQYGSALDIYNACPISSNYKYIQNLNENAEQILTNYELMDLVTYCDEAIGIDNIISLKATLDIDVPF
jgi:5'-3' exonuclease